MPGIAADTRSTREHHHVRTSCGRDLTVGRLALGNSGRAGGSQRQVSEFVQLLRR